ncbi:unnamed protein product [Adineta steineri]|uniref:Uncharacterized protein n=1 Tax=Adineta steineri TaxID=433720 RepID=A0A818UHH3_9BILA|nr:unnamed protein product [Adineta steineri]CAF3701232.1 unnamed protein product [Adineta steineri]
MDDIFANAKNILIIWTADTDSSKLPAFQQLIQEKSEQAQIEFENIEKLLESQRKISSFDIILFDLINEKDTPVNIDLLNEFFRLLRKNGYLITHIEQTKQSQVTNNFKMCGFSNCNPLDSNSSFLIENKSDDVKKLGSLWLCQKPMFDVGYSVPLKRTGVSFIRQLSTSGRGRKTWTVENEDDDDEDQDLIDENDRKKPDAKNNDSGTTSSDVKKASKNCICSLAQELEQGEHASAQQNVKSSCVNCNGGDATQCAGSPSRGLSPFKPSERIVFQKMSDV